MGTIDRLTEINYPANCQLLVSFDGPEAIHNANRGAGNFQKSTDFVRHALQLGFPVGIMFLITADSYPYKDTFDIFGLPKTYLTDRLLSLTKAQIIDIKKNYATFPPKNFLCSQLSPPIRRPNLWLLRIPLSISKNDRFYRHNYR